MTAKKTASVAPVKARLLRLEQLESRELLSVSSYSANDNASHNEAAIAPEAPVQNDAPIPLDSAVSLAANGVAVNSVNEDAPLSDAVADLAENAWSSSPVNSDWNNARNWSLAHVPTAEEVAVIPAGQTVTIGKNTSVGAVQCAGTLNINSGTLTLLDGDSVVSGSLGMNGGTGICVSGPNTSFTEFGGTIYRRQTFTAENGAKINLNALQTAENGFTINISSGATINQNSRSLTKQASQ